MGCLHEKRLVSSLVLAMSLLITSKRGTGGGCHSKFYPKSQPEDAPEQQLHTPPRATSHSLYHIGKEWAVSQNHGAEKALHPDLGASFQAPQTRQDVQVSSSGPQLEDSGASFLAVNPDQFTRSDKPCKEQRLGSTSECGTGSHGATTFTCRDLLISVPRRFTRYSELLLRNQMIAIDRGSVYSVNRPTRTYIVGWLNCTPRMACVHVAVPHATWEDVEKMPCIPVCMVEKDGLVVAALVLMSIGACWQLPEKKPNRIDLFCLEDSYREVLEE